MRRQRGRERDSNIRKTWEKPGGRREHSDLRRGKERKETLRRKGKKRSSLVLSRCDYNMLHTSLLQTVLSYLLLILGSF